MHKECLASVKTKQKKQHGVQGLHAFAFCVVTANDEELCNITESGWF